MPLPMVHMAVAHEIAKIRGVEPTGSYYLGAIAPDAVHMRADYESRHKAASHFSDYWSQYFDPIVHRRNVLISYAEHRDDPFYEGYIAHNLTDINWNYSTGRALRDACRADPGPLMTAVHRYYNDTDIIDLMLYQNMPWREEAFAALAAAPAQAYDDLVTAGECDAWRVRTLNWYTERNIDSYFPLRHADYEGILEFIHRAAREIAWLL